MSASVPVVPTLPLLAGVPVTLDKDVETQQFDAFMGHLDTFALLKAAKEVDSDKAAELMASQSTLASLMRSSRRAQLLNSRNEMQAKSRQVCEDKVAALSKMNTTTVVFLMDCTASMRPYHHKAVEKIEIMVKSYRNFCAGAQVHFGFVGYRDHGISEPVVHDIKGNHHKLLEFMKREATPHSNCSPGQTMDEPEDVAGGLRCASELDWENAASAEESTRILIHIADAPAHGAEYTNMRDRFADLSTAPGGIERNDPIRYLRKLKDLKVHYWFFEIGQAENTRKMIAKFKEDVSSNWVNVRHLDSAEALPGAVLQTLSTSVMRSVSVQGNFSDDLGIHSFDRESDPENLDLLEEEEDDDEEELEVGSTDWSQMPPLMIENLRACMPITSSAALRVDGLKLGMDTGVVKGKEEWTARVATHPFAEGASRWAYEARIDTGNGEQPYVLKRFKNLHKSWAKHTARNYLEQTKASEVARFLAEAFNARNQKADRTDLKVVTFLRSYAVKIAGEGLPARNYCLEELLPGDSTSNFKKWSDNIGHWNELKSEAFETLLEFSKFTYDATQGALIVCDLQGVLHDGKCILTDPVILCDNVETFAPTNLGKTAKDACIAAVRTALWSGIHKDFDAGMGRLATIGQQGLGRR